MKFPEVVVDGETGFCSAGTDPRVGEPIDPLNEITCNAAKINQLMADPELRRKFGRAGRERAIQHFSWRAIAQQTKDLYESLVAHKAKQV